MAGANPALLTCPRFCAGAAVARAAKNKHVGRNRFAYYTWRAKLAVGIRKG